MAMVLTDATAVCLAPCNSFFEMPTAVTSHAVLQSCTTMLQNVPNTKRK